MERLLKKFTPTPEIEIAKPPPPPRRRAGAGDYRSPAEVTETELMEDLRANRGGVKPAAEQLGISRPSLYLLIDKFPSIRKASDLTREEILEARQACGGTLEAMVDRLEVSKKGLLQRI